MDGGFGGGGLSALEGTGMTLPSQNTNHVANTHTLDDHVPVKKKDVSTFFHVSETKISFSIKATIQSGKIATFFTINRVIHKWAMAR